LILEPFACVRVELEGGPLTESTGGSVGSGIKVVRKSGSGDVCWI
jgi:hypothetical protein